MAKDMMDKISISYPKRYFTMFQNMIEGDNVAPIQTSERKQDN